MADDYFVEPFAVRAWQWAVDTYMEKEKRQMTEQKNLRPSAESVDEKLSEHFLRSEFACRCGCGFDAVDPRLIAALEHLRAVVGRPITINSGCRCEAHNRAVGGAPNSFHLKGMAADITWESFNSDEASRQAIRAFRLIGGIGLYDNRLHVDLGPIRRWDKRTRINRKDTKDTKGNE